MMRVNSWIHLEDKDDELGLSNKIKKQDAFNGIDIGWVSQMLPFIQEFTETGQFVLDPFAGIGTTLIAAQLESRKSIGIEMESSRVELIKERWLECGFNKNTLNIKTGDCVSKLIEMANSNKQPTIDLCITSVPYFGSAWQGNKQQGQLYSANSYAEYLDYIKQLFFVLKKVLKKKSHLIFMAENIRDDIGELLPMAWDIGKLMSKYYHLYDERIITYSKHSSPSSSPCLQTNRAHEYVLIAKNEDNNITLSSGIEFLRSIAHRGFKFIVYGSFSSMMKQQTLIANDIDLIFENNIHNKLKILMYFLDQDADIYCNNKLINRYMTNENSSKFSNERFFRCILAGTIHQIDLVFIDSEEFVKIETVKELEGFNNCIAKNDVLLNEQWKVD